MRVTNMTDPSNNRNNNGRKNVRRNNGTVLSDCSNTCRSIPHPRAQHAANVLDVLDDDDASDLEKTIAVIGFIL